MPKRRDPGKISLIPEPSFGLDEERLLLPDDAVAGTGAVDVNDNGDNSSRPTRGPSAQLRTPPWNGRVIKASSHPRPTVVVSEPRILRSSVTRSSTSPTQHNEISSSSSSSSSLSQLESTPKASNRRDQVRGPGNGDSRSGRIDVIVKAASAEVSGGGDEEWSFAAWSRRKKKQRSLLFDESKLLHDYDEKFVECTLCRLAISSSRLRQHMESVHDINVLYDCEVCGVGGLKSKIALRVHVLNVHPLHCCLCRQQFPTAKVLFDHRKRHNDEPYDCRRCGKSFSSKHVLSRHLFIQHPASEFSCRDCRRFFPSLRDERNHERIVHRRRPFRCLVCRRKFALKRLYSLHLASCRPTASKCPHCPRAFANAVVFKRHRARCRFKRSYSKKSSDRLLLPPGSANFGNAPPLPPPRYSANDFGACAEDAALSDWSRLELRSQTQIESNSYAASTKNIPSYSYPQWANGTSSGQVPIDDLITFDNLKSNTEVTVSQIDFPFKTEPPAQEDSSHYSAYPVGDGVAVDESPDDSLEIGEILGEIFGGSPASRDEVSFAMPAVASVSTPDVDHAMVADSERYQPEGSNDADRKTMTAVLETEIKFETDPSLHSCAEDTNDALARVGGYGHYQSERKPDFVISPEIALRCHDYCLPSSPAKGPSVPVSSVGSFSIIQFSLSDFPAFRDVFLDQKPAVDDSSKAAIIKRISERSSGADSIVPADAELLIRLDPLAASLVISGILTMTNS